MARRRLAAGSAVRQGKGMESLDRPVVDSLVGVYRADGGLRGELTYLVGKMRGTAHCGLCDITHSGVRRKHAWDAMVSDLRVPFELLHLNERSAHVIAAAGDRSPIVLARVLEPGAGLPRLVMVLDEEAVEASVGSVERFAAALRAELDHLGLLLPAESHVTRER
jgi:hypothetical protein